MTPSLNSPLSGPCLRLATSLAAALLLATSVSGQMPDPPGQVRPGETAEHDAYLFAHMMDGDYWRLYYSVSRDGLHWDLLNGGRRVFEEYRGHADICAGHDGRFYLVGNRGDDQPDINFWVSDDLIRWEKLADYVPDLTRVPDYPKALPRIGAPKLYFDQVTRQYLLTWHTTHDLGTSNLPEPYWAGQRTLFVTSPDLRTFSNPPRRLFPAGDGMATIDTIVRRVGASCYAIFKDERYPTLDWPTGKTIRVATAPDLLGPYSQPGPPLSPAFREAPTLIPAPNGRAWYLYYEQYPGVAYGLSVAEHLSGPWIQIAGSQRPDWDKFRVPPKARHGCMLPIRRHHYDALLAAFPNPPATTQPTRPDPDPDVNQAHTLESPDRRIQVTLRLPAAGSTNRPNWSATFRGQPLLTGCALGLRTTQAGELLAGAVLTTHSSRSQDQHVPIPFGKADHGRDWFNETRFVFAGRSNESVAVVIRAYDDAVAFRYELPARTPAVPVVITDETTSFGVVGNPTAYVQYLEHFRTSHEHHVTPTAFDGIRTNTLLDLPLTLAWEDRAFAAITEASLRRYAGMSLLRPDTPASGGNLICQLTPRPDGAKVAASLPLRTPWRVVLIGDRPGSLLESTTIHCLNDPPVIGDTSWIQPGKLTFHWWNGDVYDGAPGTPILSVEMARRYIDFCARHGLPIHSLTSTEGTTTPWYTQSTPGVEPGPDTDVTRPRPGFDLPAIQRYAALKQVRLWTWVHQGALRGRVDEAFAAFEQLGWSGMMVDFFDHDDQDTIEFAESILQAAARHRILIHFHGVWKPTGLERTYPNLMNHEGALNFEYLKWSDRCTPDHNLLMAFTRLIAGPMDYHLGGFRAVPRGQFTPRNVAPNVLGTRCHMLAAYVCFDNPAPMVADYPAAYEQQPGFDFLTQVPTWWDETRVLEGRIGERLVTARRKGTSWYLGGITANPQPNLSVPLDFLGPGRYSAQIWKDDVATDADPNHLATEIVSCAAADTLNLRLATGGGFVAVLTPSLNPLMPGADPHATVVGDTVWIYPTWSDGRGERFFAFASTNLIDWQRHGPILDLADVSWIKDDGQTRHHAWAPSVLVASNKYHFYYSVGPQHPTPSRIGVAVGDRPEGPFRDSGQPLLTGYEGFEAIDPMAFADPVSGKAYLYAGGSAGAKLRVFELNPELVSFAREVEVETPPQFTEGAFMHHANGRYYLSYSHGGWRDASYSVHYATAPSPVGPWTYRGVILASDATRKGPGHHSFIREPHTGDWLAVYHRWEGQSGPGPYHGSRQICIDRVDYDGDGLLQPVVMTGRTVLE